MTFAVKRVLEAPIISAASDPSIGNNIQGPSLIRVPDWVPHPLGKYYLYFADHKGGYIRLAYADTITGPWTIHVPGSLHLADSGFPESPPEASSEQIAKAREQASRIRLPHDVIEDMMTPHIASPDVHVDDDRQEILMYYHGLESFGLQVTRLAVSVDGINFRAQPEVLARSYLRMFRYDGWHYGLAMPGVIYRSADGRTGFSEGPQLFCPEMRHAGLWCHGDELKVFWTRVGDVPERVLVSTIDLRKPWTSWQESNEQEVLRPEFAYEGADAPLEPSLRSVAYGHVNQLRDPAIFVEAGRTWLLYAVAGESGIAVVELEPLST